MPPTMAATLPAELRAVFDRFITTEYVTIDGRGQPIAWPVTPYPHDEDGGVCLDVTTGLGYPKKARDAQRNPKVALLFSEPHGSGLHQPPFVLVQGTARVDEDDLAVHVVPRRVVVWPGGDIAADPEIVLDELGPGEPAAAPAPANGDAVWEPLIGQLGTQYPTAVLAVVGPGGFPFACRVPVRADRAAGLVRIDALPAGMPIAPGLACLTAHVHGPEFEYQRNFQVRGDLVEADGGWAVRPRKLVGGLELPESQVAVLRENFRKVMRYRRVAKAELKRKAGT